MITVLVSPSDRDLVAILERSGARVSIRPPVEFGRLANDSSLPEAIENLFGYDWLILKNGRVAEYFLPAFFCNHQAGELDELRVLTVGRLTAEKVAAAHVHLDIALEDFLQGSVYREIASYVGETSLLSRQNLLVPSANIIVESFEDSFVKAGARVDAVTAYQTCSDRRELIRLKTLLTAGGIDCVAFTSSTAVIEFAELLDTDDLGRVLRGIKVACLDRATGDLAAKYGLLETLVAPESSIPALGAMIIQLRNQT